MSHSQRSGDLGDPTTSAGKRDAAFVQYLVERLAFQILHHQVRGLSGFVDSHVMQSDDRRVRELPDDASFLKEALPGLATRQFGWEKFDGNLAADHWIVSARHPAVGAGADDFENCVASDLQVITLRQSLLFVKGG